MVSTDLFFSTRPKGRINRSLTMRKFITPGFGALVASILLVATLAACGGGGGGSTAPTPTPIDSTRPVLMLATSSPASVTTTIVVTSNEDLGGANLFVTVKNGTSTIAGTTNLNTDNRGMTWTSTGGALICNTVYSISASAADLTGNVGTLPTTTVTTLGCSTASWWPTTVHPIGEKVFGMNAIPAEVQFFGDTTWQKVVKNGTVKFLSSGTMMTEWSTRPVVWALYTIPQYGLWCARPVFQDDGGVADNLSITAGNCNTEPVDWVMGSPNGIIRHFTNRNECYEYTWNSTRLGFDSPQVVCP